MALIEREAALNCAEYDKHYRLVIPVGKVKELPTIDAAPVVHGHWVTRYDGPYKQARKYCSVCGKHSGLIKERPYCPNCGARMDGGDGHEAG